MSARTSAFLDTLEKLAFALPLKGLESLADQKLVVRYWTLAPIGEAPWVELQESASGAVTATISGNDKVLDTPEAAFEELARDCRARLIDAGIEPAF